MSDWIRTSGFEAAQKEYDRQEPPEGRPLAEWWECGAGIFEDDTYYWVGCRRYCEDCIQSARRIMEAPL